MEGPRVVTYFYAMIEIPMDESATSLKDILVERLKKDGIHDRVKDKIVGFISDGASVMVFIFCKYGLIFFIAQKQL